MTNETIETIVEDKNAETSLYCTECCNTFVPSGDYGVWKDKYDRLDKHGDPKRAELVNDSVIQCSCGQAIGFVAPELILPGEVVAIN